MTKADRKRWQHTSPLAAIFYLGRIFEAIAKNAVQSLAPLVAYLYASEGPLVTRIAAGTALFLAITLLASILRYWFFRYRITDDAVLIREGVLRKTQLDIKFDRIQAINTSQNIVFRIFGLVTVKFDTAGSSKQEGHLPAIKAELAASLKERIRGKRPQEHADVSAETDEPETHEARSLLALTGGDMVRIGLSSNRALILLVLLGPVIEQVEQRIGKAIEESDIEAVVEAAELSVAAGLGLAAAIVAGVLLLLVAASIGGAFLRYHRFTLWADADVLRSSGGLLTRHEHSINLAKVQTLSARQNPMLRIFRRFRLLARQAASGKPGRGGHFAVPICTRDDLPALSAEVFGEEFPSVELRPDSPRFSRISPRYVRSRVVLHGLLPSVLAALLLVPLIGFAALGCLLWIPATAIVYATMYRKYGFAVNADGVVLRRGFLGYQTTAFLHRKVQRISITQTLPQKRKGLATLRFYLASGSLKLPYVDHDFAKGLRDYVLYRVESSKQAWY